MLKRIFPLMLIPLLLNLSGCWNRIEPENYAWLTWGGLDSAAGGKIQVTVVLTPPLSPVPTGAAPPEKLLTISSATGDTIFDAVREINAHVPKRLFWPYLHAVIIGEDLARAGVEQHLDVLFRNIRARKNAWVFITRGSVEPIFKVDPQIETNPGVLIDSLVKSEQQFLGKSRVLRLKDFQTELASPGRDPVVSALGIWDTDKKQILPPGAEVPSKSELALDGSAVFRTDKLVGWLSPEESQFYLLAKGEMKTGLVPIPHPDNPQNVAGIEIVSNSAKFKAKLVSGEPQAQIKIKIKGKFGDQWLNAPALKTEEPTEDPEFYRKLGEGLEKKIKSGVEELLTKAQTDFDADIFGVGDYIMNRYPNDWDTVSGNWRERYQKTTFDVEVKVEITSANIMHSRPPVMEDPE